MVSLTTLGSGRVFLTLDILEHFLWNEKNLSILKDLSETRTKCCLPGMWEKCVNTLRRAGLQPNFKSVSKCFPFDKLIWQICDF